MTAQNSFAVENVRFEHYQPQYARGCTETRPRLSWQLTGTLPGAGQQTSYQVQLYDKKDGTRHQLVEAEADANAIVRSHSSILNPWPFEHELESRQRISVRVRVEIERVWSAWSSLYDYEVGLLHRHDWECKRIVAKAYDQVSASPQPEQLLRKDFTTRHGSQLSHARLYVVAQGVYEAELNGERVSEDFLAPGWTKYDRHIRYQTYDVTHLLASSSPQNCIAFRLAEGWYCGRLGIFGGLRNRWGPFPALMAQLEVFYEDGLKDIFSTDDSWLSRLGPTRLAELYDGEKYDARLDVPGWSQPSQVASLADWQAAVVLEPLSTDTRIVAGWGEPVRRIETLQVVDVITTPSGKTVLDFGQNLVGYVRLKKFHGTKNSTISLWHAEVLEDGELSRRPLRICEALDKYTCSGDPDGETWEPRFTYHGFRYCQIDGWPSQTEDIRAHVEAVVCHTDMAVAGSFDCSEPLINRLHNNSLWSTKGNFFSIPTDCPQRDERLGWTGDIALFAPTATKLFNCFGMLKDWMVDVSYDQEERRGVPALVVPDVMQNAGVWSKIMPIAIWHDVVILVPWALYHDSGDADILRRHYGNMTTWLDNIPRDNRNILWDPTTFQLGDWLDPSASPHAPMDGETDPILVADAFLVQSLSLVARISAIIGDEAKAQVYAEKAAAARQCFAEQYITKTGRVVSDSQAAHALTICFDLFPTSEQKAAAGERLATIVRSNNFKIATGFAGTPYILDALARTGHVQLAYAMLQARECPSWLYPITLGATTIWERWDSMMPDGSINPGEMTSFNHYSFGAVASFLHQTLAGLQIVESGWKKSRAAPMVGGGFTHAKSEHFSPYGRVACSWTLKDRTLTINVTVPPLTTMEVILPSNDAKGDCHIVGAGEWSFEREYRNDGWPVEAIPAFPLLPEDNQ